MDIAFPKNGYVYHTKFDDFGIIKPGAYQHVGDNVLALVRSLSSSDELSTATLDSKEKTIYFDYLGIYMFSYSQTTAQVINISAAVISLLISLISLDRIRQGKKNIWK